MSSRVLSYAAPGFLKKLYRWEGKYGAIVENGHEYWAWDAKQSHIEEKRGNGGRDQQMPVSVGSQYTEFLILHIEKQMITTWWSNVNPRYWDSRRKGKHKNAWGWVVGKGSSCGNARCVSFLEHFKLGQQTHRAGQWEHRVVPVDMVKGTRSSCFLSPACQIKQVNPLVNSFLLKDSTRFFSCQQ